MAATIKDLANETGLGVATISSYLNGGRVREKNRIKIEAAIKKAKGFRLNERNKLKRVPTGFPADSEYAEMLKLKDFYIDRPITEEFLLAPDLLDRTVEEFRRTQPFIAILNRAIQYAYDEMM